MELVPPHPNPFPCGERQELNGKQNYCRSKESGALLIFNSSDNLFAVLSPASTASINSFDPLKTFLLYIHYS